MFYKLNTVLTSKQKKNLLHQNDDHIHDHPLEYVLRNITPNSKRPCLVLIGRLVSVVSLVHSLSYPFTPYRTSWKYIGACAVMIIDR